MGTSCSENDSDDERKLRKKHKKKEKKSKKHKKEKKHKKKKTHKKRDRRDSSAGSTSSEGRSEHDEWVEKVLPTSAAPLKTERDDWMTSSILIPTYSKEVKREEKKPAVEQYDPKTSVRELNPHWKDGGSGLPSFRRPVDDDDYYNDSKGRSTEPKNNPGSRSGGWKKSESRREEVHRGRDEIRQEEVKHETAAAQEDGMFLTDQQLNDLGAKIIKAEIMGNADMAASLKERLEKAKAYRSQIKDSAKQEDANKRKQPQGAEEEIVRFTVNKPTGVTNDVRQNKKQKRYQQNLPPGDLADKFRSERFENDNMDAQFFKVSAKLDKEASNLENIFGHSSASSTTSGRANEEKVVHDMNKLQRAQADCERCINSGKFLQDNIIAMGKNVFLAVPSWKALQPKHCLIVPVSHYPALTHMDEDVYQELIDTCKALKRMFTSHKQEVVFFETVRYINRNPHTYVQCIPSDNYEMAPFYFKKAILESETEWAMNKKLHNIQGLEIRRTIPKGLPYFWVNFNLENGFAHVIEDQETFPVTFASETIAGILGLDTRDWRKPRREHNPKQRVEEFTRWWKEFDNLTKD